MEGRLEIVASGMTAAALRDLYARTAAWGAAGVSMATSAVLSGRVPMLGIAGFVALALLGSASLRQSAGVSLADAALFAAVTPAFAGIAQGLQATARSERWAGVVARLLRLAATSEAQAPFPTPASPLGATSRPSGRPPALPAPIVFDRVSFRYEGSRGDALAQTSFVWEAKEILVLAGTNGSGKSTCLRVILGLARPHGGTVRVASADLAELDGEAWRGRIAFLPQRPYLPPRSDVRRAVRWLAPDADDARIRAALERVGLLPALARLTDDPLSAPVDSLSVGQRQRVALARMLCRGADLFILDEPDANLDRAGIALVADLARELAQNGMVVLAAHTAELLQVADKVVMLEDGRVVSA
jgi:ABC-type multidrug transport system fused ATPase/permease subunit